LTLGLVMLVVAGVGGGAIPSQRPLGPVGYAIAGLLAVGGVTLMTGRAFGFYVALAAAGLTAVSGVMPYLGHPELALALSPPLAIGAGLYLGLRIAMTRGRGGGDKRGFIPPADSQT
jgi:hypothetical protein